MRVRDVEVGQFVQMRPFGVGSIYRIIGKEVRAGDLRRKARAVVTNQIVYLRGNNDCSIVSPDVLDYVK